MRSVKFSKGMAAGLFILSASFIVKQFWPAADFVDGFMKGLGITLMLGLMIKQHRYRAS